MKIIIYAFENIDKIIGCLAFAGIIFSAWKILAPKVKFDLISFYPTFDKDQHMMCLLKLKVESSSDIVIEKISSILAYQNTKTSTFSRTRLRWKCFLPKMLDLSGNQVFYKLLGPIEPDLLDNRIYSNIGEYYISLVSEKKFEDKSIDKWEFELICRSSLFFIPRILSTRRKKIGFTQTVGKNLYFDDSLLLKITEEEFSKIVKTEL